MNTKIKKIIISLTLALMLFLVVVPVNASNSQSIGTETTETITIENLKSKEELVCDDYIIKDDVKYELTNVEFVDMTTTDRTVKLEKSKNLGYFINKPTQADGVKKTIEVEYTDELLGSTKKYELKLIDVVKVDEKWLPVNNIDVVAKVNGNYLLMNDTYMEYDEKTIPSYVKYEDAILSGSKLSTDNYRLTGGKWTNSAEEKERTGVYYVEALKGEWEGIYVKEVALNDIPSFNAILTYDSNGENSGKIDNNGESNNINDEGGISPLLLIVIIIAFVVATIIFVIVKKRNR